MLPRWHSSVSKIKSHRTLGWKVGQHYLNLNFLISKGAVTVCLIELYVLLKSEMCLSSSAQPHLWATVQQTWSPRATAHVRRFKAAWEPLEGLRGKEDAPCPWVSRGSAAHPFVSSWPLPLREIRSRGWEGLMGWAEREGRRGLAEEAIPNTPVGQPWLLQLENSPDLGPRWQWPEVGWKAVAP